MELFLVRVHNNSSKFSDSPGPDNTAVARFVLIFEWPRFVMFYIFLEPNYTDILCETNDHLFSQGLVGQQFWKTVASENRKKIK